jgi:phosphoglycolate phosphatase
VRETLAYPGVDTMLRQLRCTGASIYLATSKFVGHAEQVLDAFSLRQYFTNVFGSGRDGALADKTELVNLVLTEIGSSKERAVMIGDREHDIIGGKANGIYTIGVTYGYGSRAELESADADAICDSPDEIVELIVSSLIA